MKNVPHAIIYLKDGTTAEGYLQNRIPSASDSEIVLKPDAKLFTKSSKFKNCDIDSMAMWYDKYPDMKTKWEPQFVDFTFGNNVSELDTHPTMVGLEYQGKHVKGYISYHMLYGFKLLYKTGEMPRADKRCSYAAVYAVVLLLSILLDSLGLTTAFLSFLT